MKREIIFRGKRLDNGEWVEGTPVWSINNRCYMIVGAKEAEQIDFLYQVEYVEVDPETIGQWTGITDVNGQRIFEDDIIECISSDGTPIRHYIKYHNRECSYIQYIIEEGLPHGFNDGGHIYQSYIDQFSKRVVGNIWDNKDLLKTE